MPTERMDEVEVYQPKNGTGPARRMANGPDIWLAEVAPGTLTSARLRLADAAEKWHKAARLQIRNGQPDSALDQAWMAFQQECEALRTARGT